jgi:polyisoprenoid-binding protein YceI
MWIALLPLMAAAAFWAPEWKADTEKAKIGFSVKGLLGTVHGHFTGLKATIRWDEHDLAGSSVNASVDASTVSTGIGLRNRHVREEEQFLNASKYPTITFSSKKIVKTAGGFTAEGELKLKEVTKAVLIPFTFQPGDDHSGVFKGSFNIKREDYNIGKPGGSIGDEIKIDLEVPVTK